MAQPVAGSANFELRYGGAVWRFRNVGNRDAFAAQPDVYMPQFGGYDPIGVARGVAVAGNPQCVAHRRRAALSVLRPRAGWQKFAADADRAERRRPSANGPTSARALSP